MFNATPSQRALLHAGESALRSAALTIGAGVYQYVVTNGLNIPGLLGFLAIAFVAQLAMIDKSIRNAPQATQGLADTVLSLPQEIQELPGLVKLAHQKLDTLFASQHTHATAIGQAPSVQPPFVVTSSNATAAQPAPVVQQPFPGQSALNWTGLVQAVPPPPQ